MHVMIEVEGELDKFMEEELWDEDAKNNRDAVIDALKH